MNQTLSILGRFAIPLTIAAGLAVSAGCARTVTKTTTTEVPGQTIVTPVEPGASTEPYSPGTMTTTTGSSVVTTTSTERK